MSDMKEPEGQQTRETRPYKMGMRADSVAETGEKILDAAEEVFYEKPVDEATLKAVAERGNVTVKTILRRFGSRQKLISATVGRIAARVSQQRGAAEAGDIEGAVRILIDHYEDLGDRVLRLLAEEERHPWLAALADMGRAYHREWCERVFGPGLEGVEGPERLRRVGQLVAVTDVTAWKVLRRYEAMSLVQTELAMREMVEAVLEIPAAD